MMTGLWCHLYSYASEIGRREAGDAFSKKENTQGDW